MAGKYYLKLFHEILDDPKMCRLSDRLYRRIIELFLLAGEQDKAGELPKLGDMAWRLRSEPPDLEKELEELAGLGLVTERNKRWIVVNFASRQAPVGSTERSQRHRKGTPYDHVPNKRDTAGTWRSRLYNSLPEEAGVYRIYFDGGAGSYIGISKNVKQRVKQQLANMINLPGHPLEGPFSKYGETAVRVEVLQLAPLQDLPELETKYIAQHGGIDNLYNSEAKGKASRFHGSCNDPATHRCIDKIRLDKRSDKIRKEEGSSPPFTLTTLSDEAAQGVQVESMGIPASGIDIELQDLGAAWAKLPKLSVGLTDEERDLLQGTIYQAVNKGRRGRKIYGYDGGKKETELVKLAAYCNIRQVKPQMLKRCFFDSDGYWYAVSWGAKNGKPPYPKNIVMEIDDAAKWYADRHVINR